MKFEINEVFFLKNAAEATNIKASDAHTVSALLTKLDKEFMRLQKLEEKKQQQQVA
jgi:histidyl-tRNA synthetase